MAEEQGSISIWVRAIEGGDQIAAQGLWARYFHELAAAAEKRVRRKNLTGLVESEDVAASVFESLWKGAQAGRFQEVRNRDELWWLLLAMLSKKLATHARRELADKRGGRGRRLSMSAPDGVKLLVSLPDRVPPGDQIVALNEEFQRLLQSLPSPVLQRITVMKIEGYLNSEIGSELGLAPATVTRKLRLIRQIWEVQLLE